MKNGARENKGEVQKRPEDSPTFPPGFRKRTLGQKEETMGNARL